MSVLLLAEHDGRTLDPATARALAAAMAIGAPVDILVAGHNVGAVAEAAARLRGAAKVLHVDDARYGDRRSEPTALLLTQRAAEYDVLLAPATSGGKATMPRVAAALEAPLVPEIARVLAPRRFERPLYAGAVLETIEVMHEKMVATVRIAAFEPAGTQPPAPIVPTPPGPDFPLSCLASEETSSRRDLTTARIIVAGGRGIASAEGFARLERFAERIGAEIGASRAAVDAGLIAGSRQIGQNGRTVAPLVYIAIGISGALQHLAGIREARCVVAINKDPDAPIFRFADIGLIADWNDALPELEALLASDHMST